MAIAGGAVGVLVLIAGFVYFGSGSTPNENTTTSLSTGTTIPGETETTGTETTETDVRLVDLVRGLDQVGDFTLSEAADVEGSLADGSIQAVKAVYLASDGALLEVIWVVWQSVDFARGWVDSLQAAAADQAIRVLATYDIHSEGSSVGIGLLLEIGASEVLLWSTSDYTIEAIGGPGRPMAFLESLGLTAESTVGLAPP